MIRFRAILFVLVAYLSLAFCFRAEGTDRKIQIADFGKTKEGDAIQRYVLHNEKGVEAIVITYGAALVSLKIPDRTGKTADVVLGYDNLEGYEQDKSFFGATIGRYGNRIAKGEFALDGTAFHLPKNDGPNTLHGGPKGFNKRVWNATDRSRADAEVLEAKGARDGLWSRRQGRSRHWRLEGHRPRLRLGLRTNDFSLWLRGTLGLEKLAYHVDRIDIYTNTMDSARAILLRLIHREMNSSETRKS